ncbi:MAG: type II toxin-antitoxin system RelE/ParE family toxin [Deltaproteobacteria bacterium]|nr:type II toxin-antitoxin system RelE/ParE family toxin [Deltaproteobacteria bacterium]
MSGRRFEVSTSPLAREDLESIGRYIERESRETAARIMDTIEARFRTLDMSPFRGRRVPELELVGLTGFRELIVAPWRIIYEVVGGTVYVSAVLDSRRNLGDVLLERLTRA